MAELNFNANDVPESEGFPSIKVAGEYLAVIIESQEKPNSKGTGSYLELVWEVIEGDAKSARIWVYLNLKNPNEKAVEIARQDLAKTCRAVGVMAPRDSIELHNIPARLDIVLKDEGDGYGPKPKIRGYSPASGAPQQQQQQAPPAAGAAAPPWQRG